MRTQMKRILTTLMLFGIITAGFAQPGNGRGMRMNNNDARGMHMMCQNIPDLTDEQESKIEALKVEHIKKQTEYRNQYQEKMAQLRTLTSGDNVDMEKAEKVMDEAMALKSKMLKNSMNHRNKVRNLLTEEQKVYFDAHRKGSRMGKGSRCGNSRMMKHNGRQGRRSNRW
ncbi:MAG: Spy/CpxP family protein refolding chaperone [Bacteroidales bacterium]|nr:Spy/CpxP family protein refolding chaperone [Bacteroidales bacterium]MCF8327698.1 Spy/CpxP family protein refolding chaperone [Bacteroidales bacterium]